MRLLQPSGGTPVAQPDGMTISDNQRRLVAAIVGAAIGISLGTVLMNIAMAN